LPIINKMYFGEVEEKTALEELTRYIKEHGTKKQIEKFFTYAPIQISIFGRRWFDKVNGNTYFSAIGMINGIEVVNINYEYGYGNQYEDRVVDELEKLGYFPGRVCYDNGCNESMWQYLRRCNFVYNSTVCDVTRKKDL